MKQEMSQKIIFYDGQTEEVMNCDDDDNEPTVEKLAYVRNMIRCLEESGKENPTTLVSIC